MPTLRTVTVKAAGGDYSSLNAANAGEVGDLVAADRALEVDLSAFNDSTFASSSAGWTTDATHTILYKAVENHQGLFAGTGGPGAPTAYYYSGGQLVVASANTTFRGISFLFGVITSAGSPVTFDRCVIQPSNFSGTGFSLNTGDVVVNCLCLSGNSNQAGFVASSGPITLYNCTAYGLSQGFQAGAGTTVVAVNCTAVACGTGFNQAATWTGSSTCASTDANVPTSGTGHRASQTITLIDPANGDCRLDTADTGAKGFGTDLSADPTFPFAIDFAGSARAAPWDIGCSIAYSIPHRGRFQRRAAFGLIGAM